MRTEIVLFVSYRVMAYAAIYRLGDVFDFYAGNIAVRRCKMFLGHVLRLGWINLVFDSTHPLNKMNGYVFGCYNCVVWIFVC